MAAGIAFIWSAEGVERVGFIIVVGIVMPPFLILMHGNVSTLLWKKTASESMRRKNDEGLWKLNH
jgi:hypothetical protein